jgi:hypothetical protein
VPKEVGKVGTESDKFIEPVAEREDGIKAMFSKQKANISESPRKTHGAEKRKREDLEAVEESFSKHTKLEKIDAWEDDDTIEYLGTNNKVLDIVRFC